MPTSTGRLPPLSRTVRGLPTSPCGRRASLRSRTARRGLRDLPVAVRTGSCLNRSRSRRSPASSCRGAALKSSSPTASKRERATTRGDKPYTSERHYAPAGFGGLMSQADAFVVQLPDDERPTKWYNIQADLPEPLPPPKDPATGPSRIKALPDLLVGECLRQENSTQRWIDIPTEIQDLYRQAGRPRPLILARPPGGRHRTPARLYHT